MPELSQKSVLPPLHSMLSGFLLLYLALYFLAPYKPWMSPISFHTPFLGFGLLLYAFQVRQDIRNGSFIIPPDIYVFALAVGFFWFSSIIVHFKEFSREGVQAYTVSFICLFFVRVAVKNLKLDTLFFLMKMYIIVSGILILLQVNFVSPFYVAGFFGQLNFGAGTQGWGFGNTHIWAGGTCAWMLSIVLTRYAMSYKEKLSVPAELLYLFTIGIGATGLFYTLNRGAWLGMALAVLALAAILIRARLSPGQLLKGLAVMLIFVSFFKFTTHPELYKMREKIAFIGKPDLANDAASLTRLKAWGVALGGIKSHPFWGVGIGQYPKLYEKAFPDLFKGLAAGKFDPNTKQIPHNSYLYYAVEAGLLPALLLFGFIGFIFFRGFRAGVFSEVFPFFVGGLTVCLWMVTCDYINERIFWIALGTLAGLGAVNSSAPGAIASDPNSKLLTPNVK